MQKTLNRVGCLRVAVVALHLVEEEAACLVVAVEMAEAVVEVEVVLEEVEVV
jgi:hypothetical protein